MEAAEAGVPPAGAAATDGALARAAPARQTPWPGAGAGGRAKRGSQRRNTTEVHAEDFAKLQRALSELPAAHMEAAVLRCGTPCAMRRKSCEGSERREAPFREGSARHYTSRARSR